MQLGTGPASGSSDDLSVTTGGSTGYASLDAGYNSKGSASSARSCGAQYSSKGSRGGGPSLARLVSMYIPPPPNVRPAIRVRAMPGPSCCRLTSPLTSQAIPAKAPVATRSVHSISSAATRSFHTYPALSPAPACRDPTAQRHSQPQPPATKPPRRTSSMPLPTQTRRDASL